ncbi:hypothetical protein GCM10007938_14580 [Vibrio zhanjiangensis]|uniref:Membrane bound FAD containing D-sorbitol dehydrogenase n=1 Tax=Vibrio zhanjiangensis TaxID=1046128 RepID=A0ABQ6EWX3_9VIBR|nr:hypothetical protein [Vibrio zhanjiangensis]GLT17680.1 hypothetical protein GCM10007938_14580 [Vibrio zhanjiangensis]
MRLTSKQVNLFIELSSVLTDFDRFTLQGTGQVDDYLQTLASITGMEITLELLEKFEGICQLAHSENNLLGEIRKNILGDPKLGPVARNIIKLWYTGTWYQLPNDWREAYGASDSDRTFFVSPSSYTEGLLWLAIGANPSGAKGPGYGSWQSPPNIHFKDTWSYPPKVPMEQ